MTTLLSSERYKLLHSKITVIVLVGVALMKAFFVFAPYLMNIAPTAPNGMGTASINAHFSGINGVMLMNGESMILVLWFVAFVGFYVASEFLDGTIRHALSLGKRRSMICTAKLLASLAILAAIFAVTILTAVIGHSLLYGFGDMGAFAFIHYFLRNYLLQLLCHVPYAAVFCLFAFIGRSPGMTIILSVGYLIFNTFAASFTRGIAEGISSGIFEAEKLFPEYYINGFSEHGSDPSFVVCLCVVSVAYIVLAYVVSCIVFNKSDVK